MKPSFEAPRDKNPEPGKDNPTPDEYGPGLEEVPHEKGPGTPTPDEEAVIRKDILDNWDTEEDEGEEDKPTLH